MMVGTTFVCKLILQDVIVLHVLLEGDSQKSLLLHGVDDLISGLVVGGLVVVAHLAEGDDFEVHVLVSLG